MDNEVQDMEELFVPSSQLTAMQIVSLLNLNNKDQLLFSCKISGMATTIEYDNCPIYSFQHDQLDRIGDEFEIYEIIEHSIKLGLKKHLKKLKNSTKKIEVALSRKDFIPNRKLPDLEIKSVIRNVCLDIIEEYNGILTDSLMRKNSPASLSAFTFSYSDNDRFQIIAMNGFPLWLCANVKAYESLDYEDIRTNIAMQCALSFNQLFFCYDCLLESQNITSPEDFMESLESPYNPERVYSFLAMFQDPSYSGQNSENDIDTFAINHKSKTTVH